MTLKLNALFLAMVGGLTSLVVPATAEAGNVGYYIANNPSSCVSPTDVIVQAGHTPVAVSQLDAASLAPLSALVVVTCGSMPADPDLDAAVAGGMDLIIDSSDYLATTHPYLPGGGWVTSRFDCATDLDISPGAPIASGPGGTLNDASFDDPEGGYCSVTGFLTAPVPAGAVPFLQTPTASVAAVGYRYGLGNVAFSMSSFSRTGVDAEEWYPAARIYLANAIAWSMSNVVGPATTCTSEGYTGAKLTWCKNICENGLSGQVLDTWIHRWTNRYRDLPYCAL